MPERVGSSEGLGSTDYKLGEHKHKQEHNKHPQCDEFPDCLLSSLRPCDSGRD